MSGLVRSIVVLIALSGGCARTTMFTAPSEVTTDANTLSTVLVPGGSSGREVTLTAAGQIAVTLTSTTPAGIVVGVGIGIPRGDSSCALTTAAETPAGGGPQVSVTAEAGQYCVKVYDPGTLSVPVPFTLSISR